MSEIHHAVDHWVEKNKKDAHKQGHSQGYKDGHSSAVITFLLILAVSFGVYKYQKSHTVAVNLTNQQVLGITSSTADKNQVKPIPSSQINIQNSQSVQTSIGPKGIDATINVNVDPSQLNTEPKKGIFQPKNPDLVVTPVR